MNAEPPTQLVETIRARLDEVREEIAAAAARVGRDPRSVRLVAVTKTHPAQVLQATVAAGAREIGENYLQEAEEKFAELGWPEATAGAAPVVRHAIGHIQANKVRLALRWFDVIETVDSLALAQRIDRIAGELGRQVSVLLQVNIGGETSKSGFSPDELAGVLPALENLTHVKIDGLMTIGRLSPDPEVAREDFIALRALRDRLHPLAPPRVRLQELSMGMSHDFAVAVEEGATIVRVGSRLFGPRG